MARAGDLGDIFEIDCQMSMPHSAEYRRWRSNFQGGDMYIFGSHLIDLIVWMMGEPDDIVSLNMNSFPEDAECIDNGLAVLQYPRATCTVRTTPLEANGYHRRQLVDFARMERGEIEIPFGYDHELAVERMLLRACGVPFVEQR